jgi:hypothetical protein
MATDSLNLPNNLTCILEMKKGIHSDNPQAKQVRKSITTNQEFQFEVAEGYDVFKAKIRAKVNQVCANLDLSLTWNNDEGVFVKPNINFRQHQYIRLHSENYEELLFNCWNQNRQQQNFKLQIFIFLSDSRSGQTFNVETTRRVTQANLTSSANIVEEFVNDPSNNASNLGPLARRVWAHELARQTNSNQQNLVMPNSFMFRQAQELDEEDRADSHLENEAKGILHVRFAENGPEVPLIVNIKELRRLVGLPTRTAVSEMLANNNQTISQNIDDFEHENNE